MRDKIIKVYSSNGTLIASFDGDIVDTPENQKEKIYNPHISIDEDNSTATFEVYKDSNVWRTISSESEIYEIDGRRYFIYGEPSQISDDNLIRVTLKEIWNELDTKYVQAYNVEGSLEYLAEYTVSLVPFGSYPLVVNGVTKTNPFTRDNLGYYIWALLQDTGYSITHCDVVDDTYDAINLLSAYQLETEGLTVLENLKQLKELTDCLFKWDTVNKTLAVYDRNLANSEQNKWQGYEIREGVNLKSIEKRKNTNITTRVIPYGSDNLTIASVNSGVLYLSDTSYSNKIYTKIINNPDIESPQALKCWAEKELTKMCRPTVEYEVDFVKRLDEEYVAETFNLYDIVRIIYFDKELGAEVVDDQRIISLNYDVWKNSAFVAKLGDKTLRWEQKLKQAIQDGKKSGEVISSSGIVSTGNIVHGTGTDKQKLNKVVDGIYTSIAEVDAKADENGAYVNLLALYANDTQGIKSAPTDTDKTLWDILYTYYAVNSQTYYKFNSTTGAWEETKPINSSLATIRATADADRANITLLSSWKSSVETDVSSISSISSKADANEASIQSINTWIGDSSSGAIKSIADVTQKATANESSISDLTAWMGNTESGAIKAIADVTQKANAHESSISSLTTWSNELSIGGRNLLKNSGVSATGTSYALSSYYWANISDIVQGAEYTVTVEGSLSDGQTGWHFNMYTDNPVTYPTAINLLDEHKIGDNKWVGTFIMPPLAAGQWFTGQSTLYALPFSNGLSATVTRIKIEKGNMATDWTPAPEDVDGAISNVVNSVAQIQQQANENGAEIGLIAEYSNSKGIREEDFYDPDGQEWDSDYIYYVRDDIYGDEGYWKYNSTTQTWVRDDVISSLAKIELKADKNSSLLELKADAIALNGYVTVSSLFNPGTTTIDGSKITTGTIKSLNYSSASIVENANPDEMDDWNTNLIYHVSDEGEWASILGYYRYYGGVWNRSDNEPETEIIYSNEGTEISLDYGYFRSKNFAIDGSGNAYLKGNIEATSGRLANWIINSDYIASFDEYDDPAVSPSFYINSYSNSSPNWIDAHTVDGIKTFSISKHGSAYFKGEIEATSGKIGNFVINEGGIKYVDSNFVYGDNYTLEYINSTTLIPSSINMLSETKSDGITILKRSTSISSGDLMVERSGAELPSGNRFMTVKIQSTTYNLYIDTATMTVKVST